MSEVAYTIRVNGRVQGVGFRATTQMLAQRLQVRGDVKNEADGSVLIHVAGAPTQVATFKEDLKQGPSRFAEVSTYEETPMTNVPAYKGFDVVY